MKDGIYETLREINSYMKKNKKKLLVKNGKAIGFLGNEDRFYSNRKKTKGG